MGEQYDGRDASFWAPGTVALEERGRPTNIILHPTPSYDPNDPLNWSPWRKGLNFGLVCFYVVMTFSQLSIGFTAWEQQNEELGLSPEILNPAAAVNYVGLAVGCILFVPLVHKYGRRPIYLFSSALQFASVVWFARTMGTGDVMGSNLLSGLSGAISETIAQVTIADLFFVHQHAVMNGWYLFGTSIGACLAPVASGYIVDAMGWRWMYWWCVILSGINLLLFTFFYEETKYTGVIQSQDPETGTDDSPKTKSSHVEDPLRQLDPTIPVKSYRQRLALITKTSGSLLPDIWDPIVVLFTFPAVAYTAITYGSILAWFAISVSTQATFLFSAPYDFTAAGVGLMNIAPFVGMIPAVFIGGYMNDKSILWLSRRNGGIYEPEMRLWLVLPAAIVTPGSILMFGLGLYFEAPWQVLAVGFGGLGFGLNLAGDISLSYTMDCYHDITGNALVGVVFVRNALSVVVLFALTPWAKGMGVRDLFILQGVLCFIILLLPIALLIWGKRARMATAAAYRKMALRQPTHRA